MKNTIFLNIGLNVGKTEPKDQLQKSINEILAITEDALFSIVSDSTYDDCKEVIKERTLIVEVPLKSFYGNQSDFGRLANNLNQDSVAFYIPRTKYGFLVFNRDYTGERYEFNLDYFRFPHNYNQ